MNSTQPQPPPIPTGLTPIPTASTLIPGGPKPVPAGPIAIPADAIPIPTPVRVRLFGSREAIFRVVILIVILSSLSLSWWSFAKVLPPLQRKAKDLTSTLSRESTDIDKLQLEWPKAAAEQVTNNYQQLRSQLFSSEAAFATWLANLNGQAVTLTLDAKADFGKTATVPAPGEKLATIPATIFVEVRQPAEAAGTESPYQRVVHLIQQLCAGQKRIDLSDLTISGGVGSISRAVVVLQLWAGEEHTQ